ncbi:hypothetical protein NPIL_527651 [Nephila pilipes]|uniref:Uncharacterized protein n=1 Tax=Nephila pilipes TaxID=299642 RepID=A0A8X6N002_NEPPI|nr:hypothetical protein NPIL_527651 [Nephila pilipes]
MTEQPSSASLAIKINQFTPFSRINWSNQTGPVYQCSLVFGQLLTDNENIHLPPFCLQESTFEFQHFRYNRNFHLPDGNVKKANGVAGEEMLLVLMIFCY